MGQINLQVNGERFTFLDTDFNGEADLLIRSSAADKDGNVKTTNYTGDALKNAHLKTGSNVWNKNPHAEWLKAEYAKSFSDLKAQPGEALILKNH